ncbi:MAG TPA: DUF1326 domain-containing protein [Solirubrobacteraceae bacterium]
MAWKLEGRYFENCSCNVPCPCTVSLDLGADEDYCHFLLAFHVDAGEVDGVDVGGLNVVTLGDTPKVMAEGNWRLGMVIDERASDEQADKLAAVFGGQLGGPMGGLAPLLGEVMGVERAPIEISEDDGRHAVRIGGDTEVEVQDIVPMGIETGEPVRLDGVFHPLGPTLTIAKATRSQISLFGLEYSAEGKSGFSAPFSWSA